MLAGPPALAFGRGRWSGSKCFVLNMNPHCKKLILTEEAGAMVEIVIVMGMLVLLTTLLWPRMAVCKAQATRIDCVNNLKQIGLASRIWSNDHDKLLSWQVSTNEKG